jgi:hypothetical protein
MCIVKAHWRWRTSRERGVPMGSRSIVSGAALARSSGMDGCNESHAVPACCSSSSSSTSLLTQVPIMAYNRPCSSRKHTCPWVHALAGRVLLVTIHGQHQSQIQQCQTMSTAYLCPKYRKRCNLLRNGHCANMPVQHQCAVSPTEAQGAVRMLLQWATQHSSKSGPSLT